MVDSETDSDCSSTMSFTVENANELIEEISDDFKDILSTVKCKRVLDLEPDMFKKPNKDKLAEWLVSTCDTLRRCRMLMLGASSYIDELQRDVMDNQSLRLKLQEKVIKDKNDQISEMQETVRSEMQGLKTEVGNSLQSEIMSYSAVVKSSTTCTADFAPERLQAVVQQVVKEEDRARNVMVFGLEETADEDLNDTVDSVLAELGEKVKVDAVSRIGAVKSGVRRPIKLMLRSSELAQQILMKAKNLRSLERFRSIYLTPDRCQKEREKHRELVLLLKQRRRDDISKHYVIRNGQVIGLERDTVKVSV